MKDFKKVINPASVPVSPHRKVPMFCKISWKDGNLSISGVIGPKSNGDAVGGCGQIDMEFRHRNPAHDDERYQDLITPEQLDFCPGWNEEKWLSFLDIWKEWHLNDMTAGCEHQQEWDVKKKLPLVDYKWSTKYYKARQDAADGLGTPENWPEISQAVARLTTGIDRPRYETEEAKLLLADGWVEAGKPRTEAAGWVSEKRHPEGLLSKPCSVCGYRYGSSWLKREVPESVLEFLAALPPTTVTPAWV